jgi:hypothetical protein
MVVSQNENQSIRSAFVASLNLVSAFAQYGAKAANPHRALSAIAADGALVLSCTPPYFGRPERGVLRYEDRLSRDTASAMRTGLLGQHLKLAQDDERPVRMVVVTATTAASGKVGRNIHTRSDLIGKITSFDGDHFVVDFTRPDAPVEVTPRRLRKRS